MKTLTSLQQQYLQKICFLLFLQLILLVVVVYVVHQFFPQRICIITCQKWLDLFLFLLVMMILIHTSHHTDYSLFVRYLAFFFMSALMAYVLALQYNIVSLLNDNDKKTAMTFIKALAVMVTILILNLILLPFTLRYIGFLSTLSISLSICLIGLILWSLFVGTRFLLWISVSLFVFFGLLLTDLNRIVANCHKKCDALNGASLLYVDLVNILQDLFVLMNANNR